MRTSRGLKWENKTFKLKRSILLSTKINLELKSRNQMRDHSIYILYSLVKTYTELYDLKCQFMKK